MKAVSLWQPWASELRPDGAKRIETRGWSTKHRGPLAIHAAKRTDPDAVARLFGIHHRTPLGAYPTFPVGAVLGIVLLHDVVEMTEASIASTSELEREWGDHRPGRFAWHTVPLVWFQTPIPAVGRQQLWDWEPAGDMGLAVRVAVNVAMATEQPAVIMGGAA